MQDMISATVSALESPLFASLLRAAILLVVGVVVARIARRVVMRIVEARLERHATLLVGRAVLYLLLGMFATMMLRELGFQLSVLLGAAGVLTVAIGFASQTAASNLVSGLFLLLERPFAVGNVIRVGATTGEVLSIDLLSTTLRTFDNLAVRIPNETMMKSEITNLSRFPIRRYDLQVGVAYKEDLERVRSILQAVAERNPLCLEEPKPTLIMQGFGDSSVNIQFSIWGLSTNYLDLRNSMQLDVKQAFDREGIEIPFPHRSLYAGAATTPLPVEIVERG